jgi:hypothetical protein
MIVGAAAMRLLPHPANVTPIAALALFGGASFSDRRLAFIAPLTALLLSDLLLGLYRGMEYQYASFALTVCLGLALRKRKTAIPVATATIASAFIFFVVSDFGVWLTSPLYSKTLAGLAECYVAAIPFLRNMLLGDFFYAVLLFGGFAALERAFPTLRETEPEAAATA